MYGKANDFHNKQDKDIKIALGETSLQGGELVKYLRGMKANNRGNIARRNCDFYVRILKSEEINFYFEEKHGKLRLWDFDTVDDLRSVKTDIRVSIFIFLKCTEKLVIRKDIIFARCRISYLQKGQFLRL